MKVMAFAQGILRPLHDSQVSDSVSEAALEWGDGAA
jgi:hypothetical protein